MSSIALRDRGDCGRGAHRRRGCGSRTHEVLGPDRRQRRGADIGAVTADLAGDGYVHIVPSIANFPWLGPGCRSPGRLDTDRSGSTGSNGGADYLGTREHVRPSRGSLFKWDGSDYDDAPTQPGNARFMVGSSGIEFHIQPAVLGGATAFNFFVVAGTGAGDSPAARRCAGQRHLVLRGAEAGARPRLPSPPRRGRPTLRVRRGGQGVPRCRGRRPARQRLERCRRDVPLPGPAGRQGTAGDRHRRLHLRDPEDREGQAARRHGERDLCRSHSLDGAAHVRHPLGATTTAPARATRAGAGAGRPDERGMRARWAASRTIDVSWRSRVG